MSSTGETPRKTGQDGDNPPNASAMIAVQKSPLLEVKKTRKRRGNKLTSRPKKSKKDTTKIRHDLLLKRKQPPGKDPAAPASKARRISGGSEGSASVSLLESMNAESQPQNKIQNPTIATHGTTNDDEACATDDDVDSDSSHDDGSDSDVSHDFNVDPNGKRKRKSRPKKQASTTEGADPSVQSARKKRKERKTILDDLDCPEREFSGNLHPGEEELEKKKDRIGRDAHKKEDLVQRRMAIYYFFAQVCKSPDESSGSWHGKDGIVSRIRNKLMKSSKCRGMLRSMLSALRAIKIYEQKQVPCRGEAEPRNVWSRHLIKDTDFEAQLIADMIEGGQGFTETCDEANHWRRSQDVFEVGRSCTYNANKRLKPLVNIV